MTEIARRALGTFLRQVAVAIVTAGVILAVLIIGFSGQSNEERQLQTLLVELQRETLEATLAEACVLALPVDPVTGRDAETVQECFTQYGLEPPQVIEGG